MRRKITFEICGIDDHTFYVAGHPELRRPFYHVPHREGVTGTAAQFVLHVAERMKAEPRRLRVA